MFCVYRIILQTFYSEWIGFAYSDKPLSQRNDSGVYVECISELTFPLD